MSIVYDQSTVEYSSFNYTFDGAGLNNLANLPVLGVFIAFDSGVYEAEPDWVEVTPYVRSVSIQRGRSDELEPFQGGNATVVLDNRTRLFDPFNTAGIYYGKLLPRKQIKIVAHEDSFTYGLFRGFVSGFPVEWTDAGKDSTCTVDCFDLTALLGAETIAKDYVIEYMQQLNAPMIIKNDVKQNSVESVNATDRRITSQQPNYGFLGGVSQMIEFIQIFASNTNSGSINVVDGVVATGSSSSLSATGANSCQIYAGIGTETPDRSHTLMLWVTVDSSTQSLGGTTPVEIFKIGYGAQSVSGCINFDSTTAPIGTVILRFDSGGGSISLTRSYLAINDGKPHCVAITFDSPSRYFSIYVDGVNVTGTRASTGTSLSTSIVYCYLTAGATNQSMVFGYTAFFTSVISDADILYLANLGNNNVIESSGDRVERLIASSNIPMELVSIDDSFPLVSVQNLPRQGDPLLPALQQISNSEGAPMFVDGDGILQVWSRNTIFNAYPTSLITLADDGSGMPYANRAVRVMLDGDALRNDVTVVDTSQRTVNVRDEASILANGISAETINTVLVDVDSAQELAQRTVTIFADPDLDLEPILIQGQYDPNYWQDILNVSDLMRRFTFKRTPDVGSQVEREMLVQQVNWSITPSTWEVSIKGSARFTGWFTVGLSLVGGSDVVL